MGHDQKGRPLSEGGHADRLFAALARRHLAPLGGGERRAASPVTVAAAARSPAQASAEVEPAARGASSRQNAWRSRTPLPSTSPPTSPESRVAASYSRRRTTSCAPNRKL